MGQIRPSLFDFSAALRARARAKAMAGDRFLDRAAAESLADRLSVMIQKFDRGLWMGDHVFPEVASFASNWVCADFDSNEVLGADGPFDIIVSPFSLQWINDLPGALVQVRRLLRPDGLFIAVLFGGGTLGELREAFAYAESATRGGISPRVSPFADVRDLGALLQRTGFAIPVSDVERLSVRYANIFGLARDLRAHAMTNVMAERSRTPLRRDTLAALLTHYRANSTDQDTRLRANFEVAYLTGWAPHESQQKPLQPGSAKTRLADALGAQEYTIKDPTPRN